jgi:hypothetical protein
VGREHHQRAYDSSMTSSLLAEGLALVMLGYVVYRLGLTIRAVRADRAGDAQRGQSLQARAFKLRLATTGVLLVAVCVVLIVVVATR